MKFEYLSDPQRSPNWFKVRQARVTASRLADWLAVSKRDGKPLKARADYERELAFERNFGVSYNNFITPAMQDGIELEGFVREQLEELLGKRIKEVGCWYSDTFVASPDGYIESENAIVEIKVLRDASFMDVLENGVPEAHMLQVQGGMLASGADHAYYAAFNLTTKSIKVIEVERDPSLTSQIEESVTKKLDLPPINQENLHFLGGKLIEDIPLQEENPWTK